MTRARRLRVEHVTALRGVGAVFGAEAGARLVAQIAMVVVARVLGPSHFGRFAVATAVFSLAVIAADAGIGTAAIQRLSANRSSPHELRQVLAARVLLAALLTAVSCVAVVLAVLSRAAWTASALLLLGCIPYALLGNAAVAYRIKERFGPASLASGSMVLLSALGALLFASVSATATSAAAGAVALMAAGATLWSWHNPQVSLARPRRGTVTRLLALGWPHLLTAGAVALYSRGDRLVVAALVGDQAAGLYAAAYSVLFGVSLLGACIQPVALPIMIRAREDRQSWPSAVRKGLAGSALLAVPIGAGLYAAAHALVRVLYGPSYGAAGDVLRILAFLVPWYFVNPFLGTVLIASDRERLLSRVALVNVAVAALAYPVATAAAGLPGLALASVMVEVVGGSLLLAAARRPPDAGATALTALRAGASPSRQAGQGLTVRAEKQRRS